MNKLPSLHFTSSSFSPFTKSSSSLSPYKPSLTAKQKLSQINFYSKFIKNKKKPNKKPKDTTSQQCNVFFFYNSKRTYIFLPNSKINIDAVIEDNKTNVNRNYEIMSNVQIPYNCKIRILNYSSMPDCIKLPCQKANIKFKKKECHANIIWHLYPQYKMFQIIRELHPNQRYNHFPSTFQLGRKDFMYKHHAIFKAMYPKDYNFAPETFILPDEAEKFQIKYKKGSKVKWIAKPVGLSRGRGVHILKGKEEFKSLCKQSEAKHGTNYLLSHYISNPHLINQKKYDLRVYVLITSMSPLKIYMYREGLVRFATENYKKGNYDNIFIHLTNYSINQQNTNYIPNDKGENFENFSKWSFTEYEQYFREHNQEEVYNSIMCKIKDIIVKTIITSFERNLSDVSTSKKSTLFELYGFDILIDDNFKAWLIEVNVGPSLHCSSPLDLQIKSNLFSDIVNIVGLKFYEHYNKDLTYTIAQSKEGDHYLSSKIYDWNHIGEMKAVIYKQYDKENIKKKCDEYDDEYYKDVIENFIEERIRCEYTDFDMLFPRKENIEYYAKFFSDNSATDDNIVIWQYVITH